MSKSKRPIAESEWLTIRKSINRNFTSNLHVAIASIDKENFPTVTPIGSLFLNADQTGFYLEKFTQSIPQNFKTKQQVCVMSVNSSKWFWLKSIIKGKFKHSPAIRLYGTLQPVRKATELELKRFDKRFKRLSPFKGYQLLWADMVMVRPISFSHVAYISLGEMTIHL